MPQRNGQNPIKSGGSFGKTGTGFDNALNNPTKPANVAGICPACKAEVPPKPGFRLSSLKCPKCSTPLGKK